MNHANPLFPICLIALASGCAFTRQVVVQTAVGPPPSIVGTRSPKGGLAVYSALEIYGSDPDADIQYHSNYKIYSSDGILFQNVNNKVGTSIDRKSVV